MNKFVLLALSLVSTSSFAATYSYTCFPAKNNDNGYSEVLTMKISPKKVTVIGKEMGTESGDVNPNYRPQKANVNMVQYLGIGAGDEYSSELMAEDVLLEGGKKLKNGGYGGSMKMRARGEGYFFGSYLCVAK
jgi:hypothetical protein